MPQMCYLKGDSQKSNLNLDNANISTSQLRPSHTRVIVTRTYGSAPLGQVTATVRRALQALLSRPKEISV